MLITLTGHNDGGRKISVDPEKIVAIWHSHPPDYPTIVFPSGIAMGFPVKETPSEIEKLYRLSCGR
jgi:hypothetical protein